MVEPSHGAILARLDEVAGKVDGLTTEVAKTREIVETWQAFKVGGKAVTCCLLYTSDAADDAPRV